MDRVEARARAKAEARAGVTAKARVTARAISRVTNRGRVTDRARATAYYGNGSFYTVNVQSHLYQPRIELGLGFQGPLLPELDLRHG